MLSWRRRGHTYPAFHTIDSVDLDTEQGVKDLEEALAQLYTQSFYTYFHRAPVLPRYLSAQAQGSVPFTNI
jgi:hypothetical protein